MGTPGPSATLIPPVAGLKDIVVPAAVSFLPQTLGWFLVAGLLLAVSVWGFSRYRRRRAADLYRRQALTELDALVVALAGKGGRFEVAARLPELLKRVALHVEPRTAVASLTGTEWLATLDRLYGGEGFAKGPGRLLPELAYGTTAFVASVPREGLDALVRLSREWLETHRGKAA